MRFAWVRFLLGGRKVIPAPKKVFVVVWRRSEKGVDAWERLCRFAVDDDEGGGVRG